MPCIKLALRMTRIFYSLWSYLQSKIPNSSFLTKNTHSQCVLPSKYLQAYCKQENRHKEHTTRMCIFLFCHSHFPPSDSLPSACRDTACCVLNEHREYIPNFAIAKSSIPCSLLPTPCSLLPAPYPQATFKQPSPKKTDTHQQCIFTTKKTQRATHKASLSLYLTAHNTTHRLAAHTHT